MVTIKFYGETREMTRNDVVRLPTEAPLVLEDLLEKVIGRRTNASKEFSVVLVNGRSCMFTGGLRTQIKDGDLVEILPLVTGG